MRKSGMEKKKSRQEFASIEENYAWELVDIP